MEDRRLLKDYRSYLKIERSMSPNTVSAYSRDVAAFLEWADSLRREVRGTSLLAAITQEDIVGYMQSMPEKTVSKRSQARALSSLRSFFNWSVMEGYLKGNPCDGIDSPKLGRYLPAVLSVEEVGRIMDAVPLDNETGLRDRAILEMLYGCGLRVSEASGMRISDLFFNDGLRVIQGLLRLSDLSGHGLQTLFLLCHLELGHCQMFLGAATLSTLHIGISGISHEMKKAVMPAIAACRIMRPVM